MNLKLCTLLAVMAMPAMAKDENAMPNPVTPEATTNSASKPTTMPSTATGTCKGGNQGATTASTQATCESMGGTWMESVTPTTNNPSSTTQPENGK